MTAPPIALIVDDEPSNRRLVQRMLRRAGWTVHEADSAKAALKMISATPYRVALLDISMPGMSGIELCQAVRNDIQADAPRLVACTAHAFPQERGKLLAAGFDDVLTKPFTMQELLNVVKALAEHG